MEDSFCISDKYLADSFGIQSVAEMRGKQVICIFKIIYLFALKTLDFKLLVVPSGDFSACISTMFL